MSGDDAATAGEQTPFRQSSLRSLFEKILLVTDGTVTELLALYAGEPIKVTKLEQVLVDEMAPTLLQCSGPSTRLLRRRILLTGASRHYLYAESLLVFDRLSDFVQQQLLTTSQPIGLLWREERLESFREVVGRSIETCASIASLFGLPPEAKWVSRSYLVYQRAKPIALIAEKWPLDAFSVEG
jgi:chorismate-pyruvate lyase